MYSWVFRHRRRLQVIYGLAPAPALPEVREGREGRDRSADRPEVAKRQLAPPARLEPGDWARRSKYLVIRPMSSGL